MNYILNNKLKFEKNRYNKPVTPPTPVILSRTLKNPSIPLPIKIDLPIQSYISYDSRVDFKLNNHSSHLIQIIKQIQTESKYESRSESRSDSKLQESLSLDLYEINKINQIDTKELDEKLDPYYKDELIINIYGVPQNYLNTMSLYEFLLELSKKTKIKIYIHAWNINKNIIDYYFQGLNVVSILIDEIEIKDENEYIFSSKMLLSYWKLIWTSMYRSMNEIKKKEDDRTIILNTRFDINYTFDINTLTTLRQNKFTKNIFLKDSTDLSGVDNPMIGDKYTLQKLINTFYYNLENVSMFYNSFKIPEASVYYENNRVFGVNYNNMFENIEKYTK
jgi:hypothetical protein